MSPKRGTSGGNSICLRASFTSLSDSFFVAGDGRNGGAAITGATRGAVAFGAGGGAAGGALGTTAGTAGTGAGTTFCTGSDRTGDGIATGFGAGATCAGGVGGRSTGGLATGFGLRLGRGICRLTSDTSIEPSGRSTGIRRTLTRTASKMPCNANDNPMAHVTRGEGPSSLNTMRGRVATAIAGPILCALNKHRVVSDPYRDRGGFANG